MKYLKQNAGCIAYPGVLGGHEGHTKLLSITLHTPYLAEIWKIFCLDPLVFCMPALLLQFQAQ